MYAVTPKRGIPNKYSGAMRYVVLKSGILRSSLIKAMLASVERLATHMVNRTNAATQRLEMGVEGFGSGSSLTGFFLTATTGLGAPHQGQHGS